MFNEHTKMAIVAPITHTIRNIQLEVVLPANLQTKGAILVYQLKSIDYIQRNSQFIETTADVVIEQVSAIASVLVAS